MWELLNKFVNLNAFAHYLTVMVALIDPLLSSTLTDGAVVAGSLAAGGSDIVAGAESVSDMETVRNSALDMSRMGTPCGFAQTNGSEEP